MEISDILFDCLEASLIKINDETINSLISESPKTESAFRKKFPSFKKMDYYETEIRYAYGESGPYICGCFCPLVYTDLVMGNSRKGTSTKDIKKINSDEYWKCYFEKEKLVYAEGIVRKKISYKTYFVYQENQITIYTYFQKTLSQIDIAKYKNGYIASYLILYGLTNFDCLVQWEKYDYIYNQNGIYKMTVTDSRGSNSEYLFSCEKGFVKRYCCSDNEYEVKKKVSAFLGQCSEQRDYL